MCQQYDTAVRVVLDHLSEQGFSKTVLKTYCQATREFGHCLEEERLSYSQARAQRWVEALRPRVSRAKFLSFRRTLAMVEDAAQNGSVTTRRFSYGDVLLKYPVPECYRSILEAYINRRREDGNQASTLQMDAVACRRFFLFLESKGIADVRRITPQIVKEYHRQAKHRTAEGKNAYMRRIRGFIRFLSARHLVPSTLELAVATEKAYRSSLVTTLSEEQIKAIKDYCARSSSPSQLRNAAMAMLALRLGLRAIDICNLRLADIRWGSRTLSITQQKTGVPLTLPVPVDVGNILARYVLEGRPECDDPQIFISLKHPYARLKSCRGYTASLAIFGKKSTPTDTRGLHVVRKTYASNLLSAGNNVSLISSMLGHTDESTVGKYLSTDEQAMRRCAIGLVGIEMSGGRR